MNDVILFDITDMAIQELNDRFSGLTINGIDDKDGYKAVKAARLIMKGYRVDIDKRRKELNEDALKHQRMINSEEKRITESLVYIEDYLANEEKKIDTLIAEIKAEEQRKIDEKRQHRIDCMVSVSYRFNGNLFTHINTSEIYSLAMIMDMHDTVFDLLISSAKQQQQEAAKKRQEEQAKIDADRAALEAPTEELRKKERWLIEEAERSNAEKQRNEDIKKLMEDPVSQAVLQVNNEVNEKLESGSLPFTIYFEVLSKGEISIFANNHSEAEQYAKEFYEKGALVLFRCPVKITCKQGS